MLGGRQEAVSPLATKCRNPGASRAGGGRAGYTSAVDFRLSDEQKELREAARRFARAELPQLAREIEEKNMPLPRVWMKRYAQLGYLGINLPASYGGHGMSHLDAVIVMEEFAKLSPGVA